MKADRRLLWLVRLCFVFVNLVGIAQAVLTVNHVFNSEFGWAAFQALMMLWTAAMARAFRWNSIQ